MFKSFEKNMRIAAATFAVLEATACGKAGTTASKNPNFHIPYTGALAHEYKKVCDGTRTDEEVGVWVEDHAYSVTLNHKVGHHGDPRVDLSRDPIILKCLDSNPSSVKQATELAQLFREVDVEHNLNNFAR